MTAQTPRAERAHETHDRLLVARFALGDELAADEAATARALLASCTDCTALVAEMRVVQQATAASVAPIRPRDFFITAEQAGTLRPGVWQRFLGRFSAPRMTVMRPLAGATLAIGVLLVGAGTVLPRDAAAPAPETATMQMVASPVADVGDPAAQADGQGASDSGRGIDRDAKASPGASRMAETAPMGSADPRLLVAVSPEPSLTAYAVPDGTLAPEAPTMDLAVAAGSASDDGAVGPALLILGVLLAVVSALVLVLAWLARRATDPLLR